MSSRNNALILSAALLSATASVPLAHAEEDIDQGQAVVLAVAGGGFNTLAHLDDASTTNFKTGFNVAGSIGYQFNRYVALRGNFTYARAEVQSDLSAPTIGAPSIIGTKFNRFLYDGDVQFRYPLSGGAAPYLFVGGGGLTVKQDVTGDQPSFTKGAGKFGLGVSYQIPKSNVGLFAEGTTWVYKWDRYGFNRTQFDTTWNGGISYRFKL